MEEQYLKLKKVPAVGKQELLNYIGAYAADTPTRIRTRSGSVHSGLVVNIGNTKGDGTIVLLRSINEKYIPTHHLLHLAVSDIESIEIMDELNAISIVSAGAIVSGRQYQASGKLDVQRTFKAFADTIAATSSVQTGVPEMELPSDGLALNRIIKLTGIIQQAIIAVLQEEDARSVWQSKYSRIQFSEGPDLHIANQLPVLNIFYPFSDINAPEISPEHLTDKLLSVL